MTMDSSTAVPDEPTWPDTDEAPTATADHTAPEDRESHVNTARITALIDLLADPDAQVGDTVSNHLRELGGDACQALETAACGDDLRAQRARTLLIELGSDRAITDLTAWHTAQGPLEAGLIHMARLHSPQLEADAVTHRLDRMTEALMLRLDPGDTPRMLQDLAHYVHRNQGFAGNTDDYYDPANSYLHTVLATRRGIPISLSCIYLILGQRLGLPLHGVAMPGHFLIKYDDGHTERVLDPFHRGRILDRPGCVRLLKGLGLEFNPRYLQRVDASAILRRAIRNLVSIYKKRRMDTERALHQRALDALSDPESNPTA